MFDVHLLNEGGIKKARRLQQIFEKALSDIEEVSDGTCREMSIVKTKLQEASFFAKLAMALNPVNQQTENGDFIICATCGNLATLPVINGTEGPRCRECNEARNTKDALGNCQAALRQLYRMALAEGHTNYQDIIADLGIEPGTDT